MNFNKLFDVKSSGNRIDLLTCKGRPKITNRTVSWWQSYGWEVITWDNTGSLPAVGRNRILDDYAKSNKDVLIMADDDITLYTHRYLTLDWLRKPIVRGVYTLNSNHKMHFLKSQSGGWDTGTHHWSETQHIGQLYVIALKDVPRQDETLPMLSDLDWAWQCQAKGIKTEILHTVFLREQSQDVGSLLAKTRAHRKELYAKAHEQMHNKWGVQSYSDFRTKYCS